MGPVLWAIGVGPAASEMPQGPVSGPEQQAHSVGFGPAARVAAFDRHLAEAYLAWAARLHGFGLWAHAEHLTVRALAAGRGETPYPVALFAADTGRSGGALSHLHRAGDRLDRYLNGPWAARASSAPEALARAQAAFDCWAALALDGAPEAPVGLCRQATEEALGVLERSGPLT